MINSSAPAKDVFLLLDAVRAEINRFQLALPNEHFEQIVSIINLIKGQTVQSMPVEQINGELTKESAEKCIRTMLSKSIDWSMPLCPFEVNHLISDQLDGVNTLWLKQPQQINRKVSKEVTPDEALELALDVKLYDVAWGYFLIQLYSALMIIFTGHHAYPQYHKSARRQLLHMQREIKKFINKQASSGLALLALQPCCKENYIKYFGDALLTNDYFGRTTSLQSVYQSSYSEWYAQYPDAFNQKLVDLRKLI